jgi:uncharacterized repeat protein (TIGR01451 family)
MIKLGTKWRARRLLLPLLMTATAITFLAPAAQAAPTVITVDNSASPSEGGSVPAGSVLTYNVTVTAGANDATGVVLTSVEDVNTTYVADSAVLNGTPINGASNPFADGEGPFTVLAGQSGTASFQVTVNQVPDGTPLTNTAVVIADEPDVGSVLSDGANHTVSSSPALTVTKTPTPPEGDVDPGDTISYSVSVTNTGTTSTSNLTFADPTPVNATYVADSAQVDGDATGLGGATNPFETPQPIGDLVPAGSHLITYDIKVNDVVPPGSQVTNNATAADDTVSISDSTTHDVVSADGLTVQKSVTPDEGTPVKPGDVLTYSVVVANSPTASEDATTVNFTDATPANTTYVAGSATEDPGTGAVPVPDNPAAPENPFEDGHPIGLMLPGDSYTFSFQVTVNKPLDDGTQITNTADVTSDGSSPSDSVTNTVDSAPILALAKTSAPAETGKVTPGTTVTYSIALTNDATATEVAHNVTLQDPTPDNMVYVSNSAKLNGAEVGGDPNPLANPFPVPDIAPGETANFTFDMKVVTPLANGTVVSNLAKMTADHHPDLQDAATHTVDSAAVLKLSADSLPKPESEVKAGQTVTFDTLVANDPAATDSLRNVLVTIPTPDGTTFVENSLKVDGATPVTLRMAAPSSNPLGAGYSLGTIPPGSSHTLSFRAKVKSSAGTITATRTVTADGITAVTATSTLEGPNSGGGGGGGGNGDGSGNGDGTAAEGGAVSATSDELAFTGIELTRLLLLVMTLLLAGWTLFARGRVLQRRAATVMASETGDTNAGLPILDRWAEAWFYPDSKK